MGAAGSDHRSSQPTQQHFKTQIVSRLPQRRWTFSRRLANSIIFPSPASTCFPIISLIKADIEECESVASSAPVPRLHNPSSPLAWRDESDSWHMLEISVRTHPAGKTALLCIPPFHQNYLFVGADVPPWAERPVKSAGRAQRAPTMGKGC